METVRVGTRGSQLALTQTGQVIDSLRRLHPTIAFATVVIKTTGDRRQAEPFAAVGTKGMFVKEIEEALLAGAIDFAVHSMKDMPGELATGLTLAAIPRREDPRDALLSGGRTLAGLPAGAVVGTSSLRRQALVRAARPDLAVRELRGNLDTRLRKLDAGEYDAIVLAAAGLERMGLAHRIVERLPLALCVPAPGQGALALEARAADNRTLDLLAPLADADTADAIAAERAFQATLGAGCTVPAGAHASIDGDTLTVSAIVAAPDGGVAYRATRTGERSGAARLGAAAAEELLARGARALLEETLRAPGA